MRVNDLKEGEFVLVHENRTYPAYRQKKNYVETISLHLPSYSTSTSLLNIR